MDLPVCRLRRACARVCVWVHRSARTLPRDDDDDDEALVIQRALCVHSLVPIPSSLSLSLIYESALIAVFIISRGSGESVCLTSCVSSARSPPAREELISTTKQQR